MTNVSARPPLVLKNVTGPKAWPDDYRKKAFVTARQRPTRRQLEVLRGYIANGSIAAAACELGIGETTARWHLSGLYRADRMFERGAGGIRVRRRQVHQRGR